VVTQVKNEKLGGVKGDLESHKRVEQVKKSDDEVY